ncbi:AAA-like domain-containing protein [Oscillatoria sp. FACHB-1407]|uniref:AAA-like domain-containing protein n=1 Tax=Oscillatoria sp. FACHB-1407 TaxID=2692847 RepID=UPI0016893260|nr:AAA-like domain-containing protein [Oscillatoria sp. FACHB-1407]MBD2463592.1 AAA-like domain-containing protein [Oscillatoria sp. FACHB-1407]
MPSLKASEPGIAILKQARNRQGWRIDDDRWLIGASQILQPDINWQTAKTGEQGIFAPGISLSTWRRFLRGQPVSTEVFKVFCQVLTVDWQEVIEEQVISVSAGASTDAIAPERTTPEFPSGPVPLDSPFYIERPPNEALACEEVGNPGSVIRIQAPHKMGKSSLILRIAAHAEQMGFRIIQIDFRQVDVATFATLDSLLRWFCANVARQLQLKPGLDEYWDADMGSKICCTLYFQSYLLEPLQTPLLLVLNEINKVFEYPQIAEEFLPLLRSWHEEAKYNSTFQKLRLIVAHSTEVYIPLHIEQSPFNVGLPLKLQLFNLNQVHDLAQRHGLEWNETNSVALMEMVGGHPYLLRLAFYYLAHQTMTLEQLLQTAPTLSGIYANYLRDRTLLLQQHPELLTAFQQIIKTNEGVHLAQPLTYKLNSMGLVTLQGNHVVPTCNLYRLYFSEQS